MNKISFQKTITSNTSSMKKPLVSENIATNNKLSFKGNIHLKELILSVANKNLPVDELKIYILNLSKSQLKQKIDQLGSQFNIYEMYKAYKTLAETTEEKEKLHILADKLKDSLLTYDNLHNYYQKASFIFPPSYAMALVYKVKAKQTSTILNQVVEKISKL